MFESHPVVWMYSIVCIHPAIGGHLSCSIFATTSLLSLRSVLLLSDMEHIFLDQDSNSVLGIFQVWSGGGGAGDEDQLWIRMEHHRWLAHLPVLNIDSGSFPPLQPGLVPHPLRNSVSS